MSQPDDNGFVKRGFLLLGGMAILVAVVLSIIFYKPEQPTPDVKDLPTKVSEPGWQVRYNATITLLRRGSDKVPWHTVREMLDEKQQLRNTVFTRDDGREMPDEYQARSYVITTLQSLAAWKRKSQAAIDAADYRELLAQIDKLTSSPIVGLRTQAEATKLALTK